MISRRIRHALNTLALVLTLTLAGNLIHAACSSVPFRGGVGGKAPGALITCTGSLTGTTAVTGTLTSPAGGVITGGVVQFTTTTAVAGTVTLKIMDATFNAASVNASSNPKPIFSADGGAGGEDIMLPLFEELDATKGDGAFVFTNLLYSIVSTDTADTDAYTLRIHLKH